MEANASTGQRGPRRTNGWSRCPAGWLTVHGNLEPRLHGSTCVCRSGPYGSYQRQTRSSWMSPPRFKDSGITRGSRKGGNKWHGRVRDGSALYMFARLVGRSDVWTYPRAEGLRRVPDRCGERRVEQGGKRVLARERSPEKYLSAGSVSFRRVSVESEETALWTAPPFENEKSQLIPTYFSDGTRGVRLQDIASPN